ncbi:MAG: branched chain amino acid ABC transporter substrate-binding protein [Actinobacteria bacterium]|nr:branched chain amino acid ABC transporter substrate-binding protein [Actinomycetota bacterium]
MKKQRLISVAAVAALAAGAVVAVAPASNAAVKTYTIGYQGPLTGEEAQVGIDELNGVKYAVKLFNAKNKGKIQVNIVEIDDQGSGTEAAKVAPGAASNAKILGIVGPAYSGATIASLPYYKQKNLPLISPSATRVSITDPAQGLIGFPVFHRIPVTDRVQGPALYKLATKGVASPKVFVIDDQSPYGVGLVQYMKLGAGVKIDGTDSVPDTTSDWSATISKVKAANANVVIFTGYYAQAATLYRQLRDSGYTGVLAGGDGVLSPGLLTLASNSILEGVRLTGGTVPLAEISASLEADFKAKMGVSSGTYAAESIDATNIYLSCITKGATTRAAMLKCVKAFKGKSITGSALSFDQYGDTAGGVMNGFEIKSGAIKYTGAVK